MYLITRAEDSVSKVEVSTDPSKPAFNPWLNANAGTTPLPAFEM